MTQPDLDDSEIRAFAAWLEASDKNRREYEHSALILGNRPLFSPRELAALRAELTDAGPLRTTRHWYLGVGVASIACCAVVLLLANVSSLFVYQGETRETRQGEQKLVNLPDQSRVYLNTASEIDIEFTDRIRFATLPSGEAFFEIAKDADRPFVVQTEHATIQVLGTKFNVRTENDREVVAVLEGRVQLKVNKLVDGVIQINKYVLGPGEQIVLNTQSSDIVREELDVNRVSAWRFGRVEFDNMPLGQAVAEINRYRSKQIIVGDLELSELPLSGSFSIDGTEGFIAALKGIDYIEVIDRSDSVVLLKVD